MAAPTAATLGITAMIMARASRALLFSEYEGSDDITFGYALHPRNFLPPAVALLAMLSKAMRCFYPISFESKQHP